MHQIETDVGNEDPAWEAWVKAREAYLGYRQQGGYAAQGQGGKIVEQVMGLVSQEKIDKIEPLFSQLASDLDADDSLKEFMQVVITILNGSRDKTLADDSALNYADAAEVLFLIERLGG